MDSYRFLKVMGNALNIKYYFWWRDDCFGLLIHHDAQFHFVVSISDEYKYKRLVKTTLNHVGSLSSSNFTTRAIKIPASLFTKNTNFQLSLATGIDRMGYYLGPVMEIL